MVVFSYLPFRVGNCTKYGFVKLSALLLLFTVLPTFNFVLAQTIVIDAGHGGKDKGCCGSFTQEKELTLTLAYKTKEALQAVLPSAQILLTRKFDEFISLEDRSHFANQNHADLFISLHCNHHEMSSVHGSEVYVMGEDLEKKNQRIAQRENLYNDDYEPCNHITENTHMFHSNLKESILLASMVNRMISEHTSLKARNIREANFKVLCGLNMPGVLLESAFISHKGNETYISSNDGQWQFAQAIAKGIEQYFTITHQTSDVLATQNLKSSLGQQSLYSIQIAQTKHVEANTSRQEWTAIEDYQIYDSGLFYYYLYGAFTSRIEAENEMSKLVDVGFNGAFIVEQNQFTRFKKIK